MTKRFPYATSSDGMVWFPWLPIEFSRQGHSLETRGLIDSGAIVNVMPYQIGLALGAKWEERSFPIQLTGNLAQYEARGLLVIATIESFPPVQLAFAWTRADDVPVILGQGNFFSEFNICFFRSELAFEVSGKNAS